MHFVVSVFAQRLGTSPPFWNHFLRRFDWQRFATRTIPIIPHLRGERVPIPWPKPDKPVLPERTFVDPPVRGIDLIFFDR